MRNNIIIGRKRRGGPVYVERSEALEPGKGYVTLVSLNGEHTGIGLTRPELARLRKTLGEVIAELDEQVARDLWPTTAGKV